MCNIYHFWDIKYYVMFWSYCLTPLIRRVFNAVWYRSLSWIKGFFCRRHIFMLFYSFILSNHESTKPIVLSRLSRELQSFWLCKGQSHERWAELNAQGSFNSYSWAKHWFESKREMAVSWSIKCSSYGEENWEINWMIDVDQIVCKL